MGKVGGASGGEETSRIAVAADDEKTNNLPQNQLFPIFMSHLATMDNEISRGPQSPSCHLSPAIQYRIYTTDRYHLGCK